MTQVISQDRLLEILQSLRGATFGSLLAVTTPKMLVNANDGSGERNPWIEGAGKSAVTFLVKVRRTALCLNENYHDGVRRQLERDGHDPDSWTPGETWYRRLTRDNGTLLPLAEHPRTGEQYLCARNLRPIGDVIYVDTRSGERVDAERVNLFFSNRDRYAKQTEAGVTQTIDRQVWKLSGIRGLNINGERYEVHRPFAGPDAEPLGVFAAIAENIAAALNDHNVAAERAEEGAAV